MKLNKEEIRALRAIGEAKLVIGWYGPGRTPECDGFYRVEASGDMGTMRETEVRGLRDKGMLVLTEDGYNYIITEAGRKELRGQNETAH